MSRWTARIRQALRSQTVQAGIASKFVYLMREHIDESYGRGRDGQQVTHAPIKPLFGLKETKKGLVKVPGFRNGGHPLRDTSKMWESLNATAAAKQDGLRVTLRGLHYAAYHDRGFKTKGPNYIPLTKKGKRHATGADPIAEGMKRGQDFFMARKGVTVPSRPFLLPTRDDMGIIGRSIFLGLRSVLKGT